MKIEQTTIREFSISGLNEDVMSDDEDGNVRRLGIIKSAKFSITTYGDGEIYLQERLTGMPCKLNGEPDNRTNQHNALRFPDQVVHAEYLVKLAKATKDKQLISLVNENLENAKKAKVKLIQKLLGS